MSKTASALFLLFFLQSISYFSFSVPSIFSPLFFLLPLLRLLSVSFLYHFCQKECRDEQCYCPFGKVTLSTGGAPPHSAFLSVQQIGPPSGHHYDPPTFYTTASVFVTSNSRAATGRALGLGGGLPPAARSSPASLEVHGAPGA